MVKMCAIVVACVLLAATGICLALGVYFLHSAVVWKSPNPYEDWSITLLFLESACFVGAGLIWLTSAAILLMLVAIDERLIESVRQQWLMHRPRPPQPRTNGPARPAARTVAQSANPQQRRGGQ